MMLLAPFLIVVLTLKPPALAESTPCRSARGESRSRRGLEVVAPDRVVLRLCVDEEHAKDVCPHQDNHEHRDHVDQHALGLTPKRGF